MKKITMIIVLIQLAGLAYGQKTAADKAKLTSLKSDMLSLQAQCKSQIAAVQQTMTKMKLKLDSASRFSDNNIEIQRLMSLYNQSQTLTSSVLKKIDSTGNSVLQKL